MSPEYASEVKERWEENLQWIVDMATGVDGAVGYVRLRFNSEKLLESMNPDVIREFEKINRSILQLKIISGVNV